MAGRRIEGIGLGTAGEVNGEGSAAPITCGLPAVEVLPRTSVPRWVSAVSARRKVREPAGPGQFGFQR
jgi:hypothetical protein